MSGQSVAQHHIAAAFTNLKPIVRRTPLELNGRLSEQYGARIYLKREDLQAVRSYKIRGAYNLMSSLNAEERERGVACASAGNHAQGVAHSCALLGVRGVIFMPQNTPRQKIQRVRSLGGDWVELQMVGDNFDATKAIASAYSEEHRLKFIHPFDDPRIVAGQGTVAVEVFDQVEEPVDCLLVPVGGGGLIAGMAVWTRAVSPKTEVIAVEPQGAACLREALCQNQVVTLDRIDTFVDGAAVQTIGNLPFEICRELVRNVVTVPEGQVCSTMIELYQNDGIVAEPAGALTVSALEQVADSIRGKTVVCVVSGGNNDISRYPEIIERSLMHQGLKHYFLIEFSQRAGSLRQYLDEVLGETDDITIFEYVKKNNREFGPALVGIELARREDLEPLLGRMNAIGLRYETVCDDSVMYRFLI